MIANEAELRSHYSGAELIAPGERFAGYVEAAARDELALPRCASCERFHWYPLLRCPHCNARGWTWTVVPPYARVFTWTVIRRALHPSLAGRLADVVALVVPEAAPDVRLVTNLLDTERPRISERVAARFVWIDGAVLTLFAPVDPQKGASA